MGMSTHVCGVRDLDGKFQRMADAKLACEAAGVELPQSVKDYFGSEAGEGIEYLQQEMEEMELGDALTERSDDSRNIYEVDVSKLPEGVKTIRFWNGW